MYLLLSLEKLHDKNHKTTPFCTCRDIMNQQPEKEGNILHHISFRQHFDNVLHLPLKTIEDRIQARFKVVGGSHSMLYCRYLDVFNHNY